MDGPAGAHESARSGSNVHRLASSLRAMGATAIAGPDGEVALNMPVSGRAKPAETGGIGANAAAQLISIIERVERLEEERRGIGDDIKHVYAEAKGNGFDAKILRKVIALRRQDEHERREQEALLESYMHALGMV